MNTTELTLREQMRITELEIESRKTLFGIGPADVSALANIKDMIEREVASLVEKFYIAQTSVPEIALLIGDADTLGRLKSAQHRYVTDLFSGFYDIEYVNNRLRIGLVHKRIGVDPKLYLSAMQTLKSLLDELITREVADVTMRRTVLASLEKLMMFDVSLVFDTYIRGMISEIEIAKMKAEQYALSLEEKVRERTEQLEVLSRTDPLTGLLNMRTLKEVLTMALRVAQRQREILTVAYFDINDFKIINDTYGHQRGDEVLRALGKAIKTVSRATDHCFRYGGDEFCVVMPRCKEAEARLVYSKRLLTELRLHEKDVSISIGYAETGPEAFASTEELLKAADVRMYAEKMATKKMKIVWDATGTHAIAEEPIVPPGERQDNASSV